MSRLLSELLGVNQLLFTADINRLEKASGHASADVRLTAEIISTIRSKTKELGLDPTDTAPRELYHALLSLIALHDSFLVKRIGGIDPTDVADLLPRIRETAMSTKMPKNAWVLKTSAAKRLLKSTPPKQLMKYLGYKSLDSMLKREPVGELFAGLRLVESESWFREFVRRYHILGQADFEVRNIDIIQLSPKKWEKASEAFVKNQRHIILPVRELGVITILPAELPRRAGLTITVMSQLLHAINEIRLYSSFFKTQAMRPSFGQIIARSLLDDHGNHVYIAGHKVHWRVVQRHFGRPGRNHPEVLEPHVQPEDLAWRKAEESLYRLEPALHFWHDTDYVGLMADGKPLSFNLLDVALNYVNRLEFENRHYQHFQDSLWNELYTRYMGQPALEAQVLRQLDYEASGPEVLAMMENSRR